MKVKCNACGAIHSLDALIANKAASKTINAALLISGNLGEALIRYLGLFRPAKSSLTFERVATLLQELTPMIHAQQIKRDGTTFPAPPEAWIYAINTILSRRQTLKLPMKSHGYLLEIIATYKPAGTSVALQNSTQKQPLALSKTASSINEAMKWINNG